MLKIACVDGTTISDKYNLTELAILCYVAYNMPDAFVLVFVFCVLVSGECCTIVRLFAPYFCCLDAVVYGDCLVCYYDHYAHLSSRVQL